MATSTATPTAKKGAGINVATLDTHKLTKKQLKQLTTKEQRLQMKAAKKLGTLKTMSERAAEVNDIKSSLQKWELDERFEAIATLYDRLDHFVRTGESVSGKIPFPECPPAPMGRMVVFKFTNTRGQKGTCDLMVRNGQDYLTKEARSELPIIDPDRVVHENVHATGAAAAGAADDSAPNLIPSTFFQKELETLFSGPWNEQQIQVLE